MADYHPQRVRAALAGDHAAIQEMLDVALPVIQARCARALLRRSDRHGRDIRQEVEDLTQEVFVALFSDDSKALRAWDPALGLSFANFIGLLAQRQVSSILRVQRRTPWAVEEPAPDAGILAEEARNRAPENVAGSRELLVQLLERLESVLSPRGLELFHRLYVNEEAVEDICAQTGLKANAVHQWNRRLGQTARGILEDLQRETATMVDPRALEVASSWGHGSARQGKIGRAT